MVERSVSNLHQHSAFSFQDGICTPEEIVAAAKAKGLRSIALTDHGHMHGTARFYLAAKAAGVRPIFGMEAYVINDFAEWRAMKDKLALEKKKDSEEIEFDLDRAALDKANRKVLYRKGHLVLLAKNRTGLANLYNLQYKAHKFGYYQKPRLDKRMLAEHSEGVIASSACMGGVISTKVWAMMRGELEWSDLQREVCDFAEIFPDRFFLELQSNEAPGQKDVNTALVQLHHETGVPLVVTMDAHYVDPEDWRSQQILHLLMTHRGKAGITLNNLPPDYRFDVKSLFVKSGDELWESFRVNNREVPEDVLAQAFENTLLADSLVENFEPDTRMRLPSLPYEDTFRELMNSSVTGLKARGLEKDDRYMERLGYELGIIRDKGLANYFLVVRNICDSARKEMLIGPGRGSAAGSLICYLTGITNIDPIEHKLMFERFINVDRVETPDIDLDFQDVDRVKDILRRDFGEDNVACLSTYGTSQIKGLLKDVCRVYDIDHNECNRVNALIDREMKALYKEGEGVTRSAITIKLEDVYRLSPTFNAFIMKYPQIKRAVNSLYGREHHVGRHASGVVIGDDLPSETSVFLSKGVVQASFTDGIVGKQASAMGLVKFDILGLATLKVISECCRLIALREGTSYETALAKVDPKTMDLNSMEVMRTVFWDGNMTGIFSVTSAGMMKLFQRVRPTCFDDIAAVCALFRPGPLGSGMDSLFADRKNGIEEVTYDHPILEEIMRDTYGCLVYQEQMLEIGRKLGKMSWKDTNRLRKLFLKKDKSKQDDYIEREERELKALLIKGVIENGLSETKGEELWEMCGRFGGYGFNRCLPGDTVLCRSSANAVCGQNVRINELWRNQESRNSSGGMTSIAKKMKYAGVQVLQLDPDGRLRPGKLKRVIHNGFKPVWEIRTELGRRVQATSNHRFYTVEGYRQLDELHVGSQMVVMGEEVRNYLGPSQHALGKTYDHEGWPEGLENPSWIDGRTGFRQQAIEEVRSRAGGNCENCGLLGDGTSHSLEFAHIAALAIFDGDYAKYHSPLNILHLCNSCHKKFDYTKFERKPRWSKGRPAVVDVIEEIVYIGVRDTFDIEMETEGHNFVANEFVSHNSHSYSYGMVTMQTAYLRTYYPMEFFAALLTAGQAADLQTYVNDIRRQGFEVKPVDVNLSGPIPKIEGNGIRLALSAVKGIGPSAVEKVLAHQPYASFVDFLLESGTSKTIADVLIRTGAFNDLEPGTSIATLVLRHEAFRGDKRLSHKKNRDIVRPTLDAIWGPKDDPIELMERERELLGFNLRGTPFSINDRYGKIDRLMEGGLCKTGFREFLEDESLSILVAPLLVKSIKEKPQKNGKLFAFLKLVDRDGLEHEAPVWGTIWEHVRTGVRAGDVYVVVLHRKEDDPGSFVIGKPGWGHTARSAASYFLPIDRLEV